MTAAGKDRQHGGTGVNNVLRRFEAAIPHHGGFETWPPDLLILFLAARNRRPRAGRVIPATQKGTDLAMMLSDIINDLKPEEAAKMRLLCHQFKRCRADLVEEKKENEALKAQIAELRRQLDETEQTNQAGDKAFVQLVNRNHTMPRQGVYRFG